ncbi:hypothetical protein PEPNEM18_01075 [Aedoeadaptatus nemausensis]|uniref:HTH cro/C1-type domain-containing protein n=1 Tax=Aedoeadaptatus nemausensis TaxID=2582829 RepID=A0A6V6Y407_9FIRM|nr:hypothetical protein [Peptoniphilus nemausensis]CAC9931757.1 hypothetical protein PEPNEM18_01075 [Peptoniphilus nemausensis]
MINSNALKSVLIKSGHNIEWLADQLGYTPANMYKKLSGETRITLNEVVQMRDILNLSDEQTKEIFFAA